jgi:quercetin dioxygenase-like cupin family protein
MINAGDTIDNPITGERITFLETAQETGGEYVRIEVTVRPKGFVAAPHVHPKQTERFEVLEGEVTFQAGKETFMAIAGDRVTIPAQTAHRFWNATEQEARFICRVSPALQFTELLETMFALANDGKTNKKGLPNPFRMAVIAKAYKDVVRLPFPPVWMQDVGLLGGAPMGRLLGYRETYVPAAGAPAEAAAVPEGTAVAV